jgi:hypothetical protein
MHRMRHYFAKIGPTLVLAAVLGQPSVTRADLIRPGATQSFPDLSGDIVGNQTYSFDPSTQTGLFQVNNAPALLATGPQVSSEHTINDLPAQSRSQSVQLKLDASGHLINDASNSYALYGSVIVDGKTFSGLLLQGTPTQFGWASPTSTPLGMAVYDLNLTLTGGLLKQVYGPDAYVRIITETNSTFDGTFTKSFLGLKPLTNVRAYNAPVPAPIPEPSTFAILLACGGAGLLYHRRRRVVGGELGRED